MPNGNGFIELPVEQDNADICISFHGHVDRILLLRKKRKGEEKSLLTLFSIVHETVSQAGLIRLV